MRKFFSGQNLVGALLFVTTSTFAASSGGSGSRSMKKIGITAGVFSDAFPALGSYGLHYNLTGKFQVIASYGSLKYSDPLVPTSVIGVTSYGVGAKYFLLNWSLSPFVGFYYNKTTVDGSFELLGKSIDAGGTSLNTMFASFGIDHQSHIGFNLGFGAHYMISPTSIKDVLPIVPYFYLGWYF